MSRRGNAWARCRRCRMHVALCVCSLIPTLATRTTLVLVMHRTEDKRSTNTGRLATEALTNSRVVLRGAEGDDDDAPIWSPETRPLFLFPALDARPLPELVSVPGDDRPVTLIVPDGNWRQASKVHRRLASVRDVPCAKLPLGEPSIYRLRHEAHPTGLATLEAIARAFALLEGDRGPAIEHALLSVFRAMVERTLWSRGTIDIDDVSGGVAPGVRRDKPWLGAERPSPVADDPG
jgi:DTW domain-containing protein